MPNPVDLAIIVTPAVTVPDIIAECVDFGVKSAVVISAGFRERGAQGVELENRIKSELRKGSMRVIGPNCLGIMNPLIGLDATFARRTPKAGNVAFLSQSGALLTAILDWAIPQEVGFSGIVSTGSMLDVGWGDLISHYGDDPNTHSILIYMVVMYVLLDGFDLGVGILHPFIAKTEEERGISVRSIGPVWDGNEVWLLAGGGTLYFAFPLLYASAFSGFYLALMVVLWLLIIRGASIELRSQVQIAVWRTFFDGMFFLSSALLAIFLGAALANVIRGVPLNAEGYFFLPFWTNWLPGADPGILDWYTVLGGIVAFVALAIHAGGPPSGFPANATFAGRAGSSPRRGEKWQGT